MFKIKKLVNGVLTEVEVSAQEYAEEMSKTVKDSVAEGMKPALATIESKTKAFSDSFDAKLAEVNAKIEKIEKLPAFAVPAFNRIATKYRGYDLEAQGELLRKSMKDNRFLNTDERINDYSKMMIAILKAITVKGDPSFHGDYLEMFKKTANSESVSGALGGYLVPDEMQWDMIRLARQKSFALQNCNVLTMSSDSLKLPKEASLVSVNWSTEVTMTETEPTFDQVELNPVDLDGYAIVSNDLLMDTAIDIVGILTEQFSSAVLLELDNQVLNGTGSPCSGVLTSAAGNSLVMDSASIVEIDADDLSEMESNIDEGYSDNLLWVFNKKIKHYIRTLKDDMHNYIYAKPGENTPGTVWEIPYFESSKAPKTDAASTAFVALGNFKYFYVGRRKGIMALDIDPYGLFTTKQTRFRIVTRWALEIALSAAFNRLVTGA